MKTRSLAAAFPLPLLLAWAPLAIAAVGSAAVDPASTPDRIRVVVGEEFPLVFTKDVTSAGDWNQIEPLFRELERQIHEIRTPAALQAWLERQSELYARIQEEGGRRYIALTCHTDNPEAEAANNFFTQEITPRLKPWTDKLAGLYLDHAARHHLDPERMPV